jgi:hypothetical protein
MVGDLDALDIGELLDTGLARAIGRLPGTAV